MENDNDVKVLREEDNCKCCKTSKCSCSNKYPCGMGNANAVYGLGVIGALIYFISNASGFVSILLGILKAILWPAFIVFNLLKSMGL